MNLHKSKEFKRKKRAKKTRAHIKKLSMPRLSVSRKNKHIYVSLIDASNTETMASASTLDKDIASDISNGSNKSAAEKVGKLIAERALKLGVTDVAFDRSGYLFHGRVKALAEAARSAGLNF